MSGTPKTKTYSKNNMIRKKHGMLSVQKQLHLIRDQGDALIHIKNVHIGISKSVILGSATVIFF